MSFESGYSEEEHSKYSYVSELSKSNSESQEVELPSRWIENDEEISNVYSNVYEYTDKQIDAIISNLDTKLENIDLDDFREFTTQPANEDEIEALKEKIEEVRNKIIELSKK